MVNQTSNEMVNQTSFTQERFAISKSHESHMKNIQSHLKNTFQISNPTAFDHVVMVAKSITRSIILNGEIKNERSKIRFY